MSGASAIQWTNATWNPVVGCTKISPGCKNCYAKTMHDRRHKGKLAGANLPEQYSQPFEILQTMPGRLTDPLRWQKPKLVFVNSVSDLFHEDVPFSYIRKVFGVMSSAGQHRFQILTKREDRMHAFFTDPDNSLSACQAEFVASEEYQGTLTPTGQSRLRNTSAINGTRGDAVGDGNRWPLPNVWLGVSIEDKKRLDERALVLSHTPAAVRFWSVEPLLEHLGTIRGYLEQRVDWVIVGGESGPRSRPCYVEWIRSVVRQCQRKGVACFVKQLGSNYVDAESRRLKDSHGGDPSEWPEDLRVREFPEVRA